MSYVTAMAVKGGIIMAADRQAMLHGKDRIASKTIKKLFTIGDNIGVNSAGRSFYNEKFFIEKLSKTKSFNSPLEAAMEIKYFFSNYTEPVKHERHDGVCDYPLYFIAGYDKSKMKSKFDPNGYQMPTPEIYHFNTKDNNIVKTCSYGFTYCGANYYFDKYVDKINENIYRYTLQDAVDITKFSFDISRNLQKYLDFEDRISEDIEMIAITPHGIEWIQKKELEVVYGKRESAADDRKPCAQISPTPQTKGSLAGA
jgi:20S proteasome alpha/beta subunit